MRKTMLDVLETRLCEQPEDSVFAFLTDGEAESDRLTFRQLTESSRGLALRLSALARPGSRVILLYSPGLDFIVSFFACLSAGMIAVPVSPPRRRQSMQKVLGVVRDSGASLILTDRSVWDQIGELVAPEMNAAEIPILLSDEISRESLAGDAHGWTRPAITADTTAFLQYTSGSTGFPKGVCVSHNNLIYNSEMTNTAFGHDRTTTMVGWLPLFHDMGLVGYVIQPVYNGFMSVLMPPAAFLQTPSRWLRTISKYRGTTAGGPDFAYALCANKYRPEQMEGVDLSSWRLAFNGAEPVRSETLRRFAETYAPYGFKAEALHPCYGMAETTLIAAGGGIRDLPVVTMFSTEALEQGRGELATAAPSGSNAAEGAATQRALVSCGASIKETVIKIVDPELLTECAPGQVGEIWMQGEHVAGGYWNKPELSTAVFGAHIADSGQGPFLRSGDLGFIRDGHLYVTGRIKDLIILKGRNLYPQDLELALQDSHPAFQAGTCAAFSVEVNGEERLVAVQELRRKHGREEYDVMLQAARAAVAKDFEVALYDLAFISLLTLPKTSSGKVQRRRCKELYLTSELRRVDA